MDGLKFNRRKLKDLKLKFYLWKKTIVKEKNIGPNKTSLMFFSFYEIVVAKNRRARPIVINIIVPCEARSSQLPVTNVHDAAKVVVKRVKPAVAKNMSLISKTISMFVSPHFFKRKNSLIRIIISCPN